MCAELLDEIERYYDAVPRPAARVEELPPFVLFVQRGAGWPYYARPAIGTTKFSAADVALVRARQRELGVPELFEWVAETTPALRDAATAGGLHVTDHPLMVLADAAALRVEPPSGVSIRLASPEDDLARMSAVARVGFSFPGTAIGAAGHEEADRAAAENTPAQTAFTRERLAAGFTVMAVALLDGRPVGVGSHQPIGPVTEITGVAMLPAFRRRGIAAALTALLVREALARGVRTVFLSADDDEVGRVYERIGFRSAGTACIAEPAEEAG